jgi:trehalose 6-phosphate phosphatase
VETNQHDPDRPQWAGTGLKVGGSTAMLRTGPDGIDQGDLAPPPPVLDGISLFLDFDGTLVEIAASPDAVIVPSTLIAVLEALAERLPGRVAIVSGRSLAQIDALLGGFTQRIAMAGSHGAELRGPGISPAASAPPAILGDVADALDAVAVANGLLVERKTLGVALHYRQAPHFEEAAVAVAEDLATRHGLVLQRGKMMVELRADGDKGRAVTALLGSQAMAGTRPIFFGDDVTDEDGFVAAAAAGGAGVLVGPIRPTAARHRVADVTAVLAWARAALRGDEN